MPDLNKVIMIGRLTADPEIAYTAGNTARTTFRIAINRRFKNSSGELQEEATFVPIVVWGPNGENCERYLSKGSLVSVDGRLRVYDFTDKDGNDRRGFEIVAQDVQFLTPKSDSGGGGRKDTNFERMMINDEAPF